jgi:hypothetical protein
MNQTIRTEPRISVAKLGEYLTATPRRRRAIIGDQKKPRDAVVIWYMEARRALVECVLAGGDLAVLQAAIEQLDDALQNARADTNDATRATLSMDAIDAFAQLVLDDLDLGSDIEKGEPHRGKLDIGGVAVSVSPDILVRTKKGIGAVVLYFNKGNPLDETSGGYVASLVHQFVEDALGHVGPADRRACQVIDVMQGKTFGAPVSYKSRRKDIEAACREIASVWPGV